MEANKKEEEKIEDELWDNIEKQQEIVKLKDLEIIELETENMKLKSVLNQIYELLKRLN